MTNTQRNSTVIGIVLALILGGGYYYTHRLKKEDDLYKGKNKNLKVEIKKLDDMLAQREKIERDYEALKIMIAQQSKILAQTDNPAITYNYLLKLLKWMKRNINFDFSLSAKKAEDASWNEYIISGNSNFLDVANFIKELEYQRPVLTIEEVTIADNQSEVSDTVQFSVVFKTHFSTEGSPLDTVQEKDVPRYSSSFISFRPRIYETPPDTDIDPSLVRIDKALIVGITPTRVFLRDDRGIIHILSVGDRVAYGYLYSIDPKAEKIVFRLNQYGSPEDKTLFIQKANKQ
jgi:hypothetical protein